MTISLVHVARAAGVSAKTVSGALHGGTAAMSPATRERVRAVARELGYVPNLAARGMRQGRMPVVGIVADGLITAPSATGIMRAFDNALRAEGLQGLVCNLGADGDVAAAASSVSRFMPRAVAFASLYHKEVVVPEGTAIALMVNCRDAGGRVPALVPAEVRAAADLVRYLLARGRRRLAFLNLPGLLAGRLRREGFADAHCAANLPVRDDRILPAVAGRTYHDRARTLVPAHVAALMSQAEPPDAILCGNDRVALEVYNALRRHGARVPDDVAVVGFDNQVEIAARLDPQLTTMALPHRAMGRLAADILLGRRPPPEEVEEIPFTLVERGSA